MQIIDMPYRELTAQHLEAWSRIQSSEKLIDSPFFCPEFTSAVAAVRDDVRVAVLQENDVPVGFFPYHRETGGRGTAVGGDINQFHGVIAASDLKWEVDELLRQCELQSWSFDHVPTGQSQFDSHAFCTGDSPCIDLTQGFEAYCQEKRREGKAIEQAMRKARKMEREVGPLRFELHDESPEVFNKLLEWKSEQHRRTNVVDAFQIDWLVSLLDRLRTTQEDGFAGLMSALYAGDNLVAVHLGLRSRNVAHIWYPAFDMAFGKHSPGITMLMKLAEALDETGIKRIDFAARQQVYKTRFMNGAVPVYRGVADRSRLKACVRRSTQRFREQVRATPFATPMRVPLQLIRRVGQWLSTDKPTYGR